MSGETDLGSLLGSMSPRLQPGIYVFTTLAGPVPGSLEPLLLFREREGTTLVLSEKAAAETGLEASFRCRMITLDVHSSLEAVGFLAAITARLADAGISVNPVSAFHHDHLFVPADRAGEALSILEELASAPRG